MIGLENPGVDVTTSQLQPQTTEPRKRFVFRSFIPALYYETTCYTKHQALLR